MINRRIDGHDACPIDELPLSAEAKCSDCPYFRGASKLGAAPWTVFCNWPRSGRHLATSRPVRFDADWWNAQMVK